MTFPNPANANLKITLTQKGKLEVSWKGEKLPATGVELLQSYGNRADVVLRFSGLQIQLDTEEAK